MATVKFTFNPFEAVGESVPRETRDSAIRDIADFIAEQVLSDVSQGISPVNGSRFPALSKDYKKKKTKSGRAGRANLEFSGDMLDALQTLVSGNRITLQVTGKQGDKADGHNNHSGASSLPERRFIPKEGDGDSFRAGILRGIQDIIKSYGD